MEVGLLSTSFKTSGMFHAMDTYADFMALLP